MIIEQLKLSKKTVFLQGISLKGSFTITNPNQLLAISYQIEIFQNQKQADSQNPDTTVSMGSILSVFPVSGILLKQQVQKITIKTKNKEQFELESFLQSNAKVMVKYSLNNNFNKILIRNNKIPNITNQSQLEKYSGIAPLEVQIGTDHMRLINQIQNQVMLSSSLGKDTINISGIANSKVKQLQSEENNQVFNIINSLQLNSKIKDNQIGQVYTPILNQQIYAEDGQNNLEKNELSQNASQNGDFKSFQLKTARNSSFSNQLTNQDEFQSRHDSICNTKPGHEYKISNLQVLILAVLAAFFYSLGSNLSAYINL